MSAALMWHMLRLTQMRKKVNRHTDYTSEPPEESTTVTATKTFKVYVESISDGGVTLVFRGERFFLCPDDILEIEHEIEVIVK